jgi:hypothetical protein
MNGRYQNVSYIWKGTKAIVEYDRYNAQEKTEYGNRKV